MKKLYILLIFIVSLTSCEKKTDWTLQSQASNLIVVDGTITNETKMQSIKLTFPVSQLNETPKPVSGATVIVSNDDSTFSFTESPANSGIYQHYFKGTTGENYTLLINYNNNILHCRLQKMIMILCFILLISQTHMMPVILQYMN